MHHAIEEIIYNTLRNVIIILLLALILYIFRDMSLNTISMKPLIESLPSHVPFLIFICSMIYLLEYAVLHFPISTTAVNFFVTVLCTIFAIVGVVYINDMPYTNEHDVPIYFELESHFKPTVNQSLYLVSPISNQPIIEDEAISEREVFRRPVEIKSEQEIVEKKDAIRMSLSNMLG